MIRIECSGADSLPLDSLEEFQGKLKKRTKKDIEQIIISIEKYGFSFPFFVWNGTGHNLCMDGHGRIQALVEMRKRGEDMPLFPVVYVDAKNDEEARQKLLRLNSSYGAMSKGSVLEFADGIEVDYGELSLLCGKIEFAEDKEVIEADIPFTEVLGEENNYIVLKFETDIDFINAQTLFGLKTVKALSTKKDKDNTDTFKKMGIGRVLNGVEAIEKIRNE
jgi:hypothetical protein